MAVRSPIRFSDSNNPSTRIRRVLSWRVRFARRSKNSGNGFSLLEILVVLVIIGILVTLSFPLVSGLRARAQRIQCTANLRSLYTGAELYVQTNGSWPQIAVTDDEEKYAADWIAALKPFGPTQQTWICPTIQNLLGNPNFSDPLNVRTDYVATTFDDKPTTPHLWPRQPWFAEVGDVHGNGNLIIFTDGSISDLNTVAAKAKAPAQ